MNLQAMSLAFLATVAVGSVAWVFLYPLLSGEKQAESRRASVAKPEPAAKRQNEKTQRSRREQVESSLKDLEARRDKQSKVPLSSRLTQAGLSWTVQKFYIFSAVLAAIFFAGGLSAGGGFLGAAGLAFAAGFGLPRWGLAFLKKRREAAFLKALPDAVDVIVRGIKAGLPLFESIKVVAADSPEPLRSEFIAIIETQAIGIPLGEACARLYERMPVPEANFFGIVVAIQQKSWQPVGGAWQSFQGAARPQEDGREDPGDVDGSEGIRRHHRLASADRHDPRLYHHAGLHLAALDPSDRAIDAGRLRDVDVDRDHGDEKNDQLRLLTVRHD